MPKVGRRRGRAPAPPALLLGHGFAGVTPLNRIFLERVGRRKELGMDQSPACPSLGC